MLTAVIRGAAKLGRPPAPYDASHAQARLDPYLLLLLVLALPALTPLAAPGYMFDAHDGRHSVFYVQMFGASIATALWPRWAMHHTQGLGYRLF
ncbi:MAG: hypothetical protein H6643_09840 [Caldilineaceae bacterium]|nr:hypothetical protein [Caldilineaceae bacterium]